ncbi:MAG: ABC transporter ATP-binding protein [Deltaproteobacteria bacterium]|nr:ABC transporter ATP-binding protein [Deltaproteobacteria bacterium]
MSDPVLQAVGLTKKYASAVSTVTALDAASFEVRAGEAVALLGPNGAGKTTAMQCCLGLLTLDGGEVKLFGKDPELLEVRQRIGFSPDAPQFPSRLTGLDVLELHGTLLGQTRAQARKKAEELAQRLGLAEAARRSCGGYSRGQGQRLGLAAALMGDPELLFLDEPTAGLDPSGVAAMRTLIADLKAKNVAVVLNSHLLSEVERVCDRALFIKSGRILRTHDMHNAARFAEIRVVNAAVVAERVKRLAPEGVFDGNTLRVPIASEDVMPGLLKMVIEGGGEVLEARASGAELERLYLEIVEPAKVAA